MNIFFSFAGKVGLDSTQPKDTGNPSIWCFSCFKNQISGRPFDSFSGGSPQSAASVSGYSEQ